jgi:hypothetical protein
VAGSILQAQPFYITNPNYDQTDPGSPAVIQDPTATATPEAVQWTSANGLMADRMAKPLACDEILR